MTDAPTPGNRPTPGAPTPAPAPAPTPGSVNKEVPAEAWKRGLAETAEAPANERHTALSALLDDLETQVGSL
ncbi:hypothetical protein [Brevibacterium casei]|uniref:Uncharacterized protein n=1 Tax=Brevibacterium casei S18 TaxID=1229781 RepID=K9ATP3_9MICO|nr:hypothetical protein [Brevibacterium casei]EKU45962.1 hypothetical protein C272_13204 [Brevibacterium casei S18]